LDTVLEILGGVYRITLPMPFRLKEVNVFAALEAEGFSLIDTGPNMAGVLPALEAALAEIGQSVETCRRILITHTHADHCGLAGPIADRSGAGIFLSETEALKSRTFSDEGRWIERFRRFGLENGLDAVTLGSLARVFSAFRNASPPFVPTGTLAEGEPLKVGGRVLEVIPTPGHSRGHCSFYLPAERLLIAGDHVLPQITPNLSPDPLDPSFRPLKAFLEALDRVASLPVAMVHPAHGRPFQGLRERVEQIRDHHRQRKGLALAAVCGKARTADEVSRAIFGDALPPFDRYLALNESYVHLIELEAEGVIGRQVRDGLCLFSKG